MKNTLNGIDQLRRQIHTAESIGGLPLTPLKAEDITERPPSRLTALSHALCLLDMAELNAQQSETSKSDIEKIAWLVACTMYVGMVSGILWCHGLDAPNESKTAF